MLLHGRSCVVCSFTRQVEAEEPAVMAEPVDPFPWLGDSKEGLGLQLDAPFEPGSEPGLAVEKLESENVEKLGICLCVCFSSEDARNH